MLTANILYVAYRLLVTGPVVRYLTRYVNYYTAVLIVAQLSFIYDNVIFASLNLIADNLYELLIADILYTIRVVIAWFVIRKIWDYIGEYYLAVFIGAELTFIADIILFGTVYG